MAQEPLKGLISFSTNSNIVTGTIDARGFMPSFTTQLIPGDLIKLGPRFVGTSLPADLDMYYTTVKSIQNDITLTLTKPYLGNTGSSDSTPVIQNEIKAFLYKKIPDVYKEEIPEDEFQIVLNVISSAYLELLPRIKEMNLLYDINNVDLSQLPYIGYLFGFQFDENLGRVSSFLQQPILKRNQVQNAVAWQKLKGSMFGIQQYLKTLAIAATIKELWYDSTFRNLLDSKVEILSASELWQEDITSNSIQYFKGNNGIDTNAINSLVQTVVNGNLVYTPVVNTTIKAGIWQQEITPLTGGCAFTANSQIVNGTLTAFLAELIAGDRIKLNTGTTWYTIQSITSDTQLILTEVVTASGAGATSRIKQAKVLKTELKQNGSGAFEYDGLSLIPVNLGKVIIKSYNKEPFNTATGNRLYIRVNGGITQSIWVGGGPGGYQTAGVIINNLNNSLSGAIAYGDGEGHIIIENQTNGISSTLEIVSGANSINTVLGFDLGIYNAATYTAYDATTEFLSIELLNPTDFSILSGEINIIYDYLNYTAPDIIKEFDYKTGAKSNWFDIEFNSSFILLPDDVAKIVTQVKANVKPFHALLRTIRYASGFIDTWEWKPDQPSFFKNCREDYLLTVNAVPSDVLQPGSCACQCCLLYNNCIKKIYNGTINYNWGIVRTSVLTGSIAFTTGSMVVTGTGSFFTTQLLVKDQIRPAPGSAWYEIANIIDDNNLLLSNIYTDATFIGDAAKVDILFCNGLGIYYDSNPCLPYHMLILYNGYISSYGGSNNPTHNLLGDTIFTNGSDIVTGIGTIYLTQLVAGYYIKDPVYNVWYIVINVIDDFTVQLECIYAGPTATVTSAPALDSSIYTHYVYDYSFIDSGIFQNRMIIYYDGTKYTDTKTGETCIFHYDLGEYPKIIGLNDEEYIINVSNNLIQVTPQRVRELTGDSTFFNSDTVVLGTQTIRGEITFTNGSDIVVGNIGPGSNQTYFTTDLVPLDYIRPMNLTTPYATPYAVYQILAIIDDQHLQLTIPYADVNYAGDVSKLGGGNYLTELIIGDWIKPSSIGSTWYQVAFIASNDILLLTSNYLGPAAQAVTDKLVASYTTYNITLTPGLRDADYIANEINYQIGQQSIVDGTLNSATWTLNSKTVSAPIGTGNFDSVSTGDWIRNDSGSTWYQIDYVIDADNVMLNEMFSDPTITETGVYGKTILISWGIPYGANIGFVRLLAKVGIDTITGSKGAILLDNIANNAYTVLGFNKLYSKASPCYLLYNPASSSVMQIISVTGSVTIIHGSAIVGGVGTAFLSDLKTGDLIKLSTGTNSQWSFIADITSNTNLILDGNYTGLSGTETDVRVMRQLYDTRLTGTVSFGTANPFVTGINSLFLTEVSPGDLIRLPGDAVWGEVLVVPDDNNITLTAGYGGSTASSAPGTTRKVRPSLYILGGQTIEPDSVNMEVTTV